MRQQVVYLIVAFITGGVITYLFLPEKVKRVVEKGETKIVTVTNTEIVEVEKEVIKEVTKEVVKHEKKTTRRISKPDGTLIEEEIYETNEQQVSRIREEEQARAREIIASKTRELEEKFSKRETIIDRPKRFSALVGYDHFNKSAAASFSYQLWGPLSVGVIATTSGVYPGIGVKF